MTSWWMWWLYGLTVHHNMSDMIYTALVSLLSDSMLISEELVCFFYCVTVVVVVEDPVGGDTAALQLSLTSICVRRGLYSPSSHVCSGVREPTNYLTHLMLIPSSSQPSQSTSVHPESTQSTQSTLSPPVHPVHLSTHGFPVHPGVSCPPLRVYLSTSSTP